MPARCCSRFINASLDRKPGHHCVHHEATCAPAARDSAALIRSAPLAYKGKSNAVGDEFRLVDCVCPYSCNLINNYMTGLTFAFAQDYNLCQGAFLKGKTLERWQELCSLAATEQNPKKLIQLIDEINRLLEEKEQRLTSEAPKRDGAE